jgi:hypothetical protein
LHEVPVDGESVHPQFREDRDISTLGARQMVVRLRVLRILGALFQDLYQATATERVRALEDTRLVVALQADGARHLMVQASQTG